ncbi:MAG: hypothetical protein ACFFD4_29045 [Candidatus Odinarchaeota archaeon]
MTTDQTTSWDFREPRKGLKGEFDKFFGPDTNKKELTLILVTALAGGVLAVILPTLTGVEWWNIFQYIVVLVLSLDVLGGVVTNVSNSAKRWYHRPGQPTRNFYKFILPHLHPVLLGMLFLPLEDGLLYGFGAYFFLILSATIILQVPVYYQRMTAFVLYTVSIYLTMYLFPVIPALEWFLPVFYLKLLLGHLVREEPYVIKPASR